MECLEGLLKRRIFIEMKFYIRPKQTKNKQIEQNIQNKIKTNYKNLTDYISQ